MPSTAAEIDGLARLYDQQLRVLAGHFSNVGSGRADSAAYVAAFFHEIIDLVKPDVFIEAGAYRAEASRRVREAHPDCRVVAFEANPYNVDEYAAEIRGAGVEYLHLAVTDTPGTATFHLRRRNAEGPLRPRTGNSSLLRRADPETEYEEISIDAVSLDSFFSDDGDGTFCLWVDVEGALEQLLNGAERTLRRTAALLIEVGEAVTWVGEWRALDVTRHLLAAGFVPVTRDIEYEEQHNVVFLRNDVYERSSVLRRLEIHINYLVQHMGHRP